MAGSTIELPEDITEPEPAPQNLPASNGNYFVLRIEFNPQTQHAEVKFDPQQIRDWDFVLALLEMGKLDAQSKRQMTMIASMQAAAVQQAQEHAVANMVKKIRH